MLPSEEALEAFLSQKLLRNNHDEDEDVFLPLTVSGSSLPPLRHHPIRGRKVGKQPQMIATLSSTNDQLQAVTSVSIGRVH